MELNDQQKFTIGLLYWANISPLVVVLTMAALKKLPSWIPRIYAASFLLCAFGWEIWWNYGLVGGDPVDERRAEVLQHYNPQHLNWFLNSFGDAGSIALVGLFLVGAAYRFRPDPFQEWKWPAFAILFTWYTAQNLWIGTVVYSAQIADEHALSWAPFSPAGPWWNPILFHIGQSPIHLQTELPWIIMTPIIYALTIAIHRKHAIPKSEL
jgi:hypothetical protein